ncbi:hypothetical protein H6F88_11090 [Oculatella sp. FACHB-28]|uniref:hypothetical protein n=1 Tax=Cyanophyceae TaxID=3028117 RepID=UPI001686CFD8|nr:MULTISPECIES: hypothetical protein [Cyanophyceae]MBD1998630.1 hypothetical protein [Leptolyngbya sp. FACHB-541]MBD2056554.1 hypothetical protein [Oculatella sp. FACHB-28]
MDSNAIYILKVFIVSGGLAVAIKYVMPLLSISSSTAIVLTLVLLPSVALAIALAWRAQQQLS